VLVPVRNAQAILQTSVQRLLDVLPELSNRFEVLIVDDGSTDATSEVAYELAHDYPQVKVTRQANPLGWAATVAKQAKNTSGEFLMINCGGTVEADDIVSLWRLRHNISPAGNRVNAAQLGKSWRVDSESNAKRPPAGALRVTTLLDGSCIHAQARNSNFLMLKRQQLGRLENTLAAIPRPNLLKASSGIAAKSRPRQTLDAGPKPNGFLSQLKTFALGE
jgi:cellulose synthase/poly-beta-1,6-N-acetylglucosamine synthase-like glycosyltransferase